MSGDSDELDELLEDEDIEVDRDSISDISDTIQYVEEELERVSDLQMTYTGNLLKIGLLAWIFGFSVFVWELLILGGPGFEFIDPTISIPLLVATGAAPVVIMIFLIQSNRKRLSRLRRIRKKLQSEYHSTVMDKVEREVA